jgi:DNA-binding transcriptional ArsR family regulator
MAFAKKNSFRTDEQQLARYAKALAHPARVAIMKLLLKRTDCICGDIVDELPLAQATISQHLKELKAAGLIQGTIDGPRVCYCVDHRALDKASAFFDKLLKP